jgi:serine/threonine-protein kinase
MNVNASPLPEIIGGKYKVVAQIGKGGMATVYSAVHVGTDRRVAVKVMMPTHAEVELDPAGSSPNDGAEGSYQRFAREARIAGNIETQHVSRVFDTGLDPVHGPYIVMELLKGEDLKDLVLRLGPLRPDLALRIVGQACVGLARAHAAGVVHRDVKASNLFLAETEFDERVVKVLDFGIAKGKLSEVVDATDSKTLTKTGAMLGSPHYMSPEQVLGTKDVDHRSDIWSLGVVLYKCLSARTPFDDRDTVGQLIVSIVQAVPPSVQDFAPWVAPDVARLVARALRQKPADRFQSAQEMADAIRALLPSGELEITPAMLTAMTDDERRDVKTRLSAKITVPDALKPRRPGPDIAVPPPAAVPRIDEHDSTFGSATTSFRFPSVQPSLGRKLGAAAMVIAACGALAWAVAPRGHVEAPVGAASTAPPPVAPAPTAPTASQPQATDTSTRHVEVQVQPATASVEVDNAAAVVTQGAVRVDGVLGSVHKVRVRAGNRETTVEVILAEDGARPHLVSLPELRTAAPSPPSRRASAPPTSSPSPAKSAARFDTQFE